MVNYPNTTYNQIEMANTYSIFLKFTACQSVKSSHSELKTQLMIFLSRLHFYMCTYIWSVFVLQNDLQCIKLKLSFIIIII